MALVGKNSEKNNQNLMQLIRRAHGLVEKPDLEKHRQSQDHIGELLGNSKEIQYRPVDIEGMDAEWVSVNRAHMKKYVILHCHGGGYSTGSSIYARTLTSKLASGTSMDVLCFDYRLAPEHPYPAATEDAMKAWNYLMLLGYAVPLAMTNRSKTHCPIWPRDAIIQILKYWMPYAAMASLPPD